MAYIFSRNEKWCSNINADFTGYWDYEMFPEVTGQAVFTPQTTKILELNKSYGPACKLISSFVFVQMTIPFKLDCTSFRHRHGLGIVLDAGLGYILVDRKTCPLIVGDVLITFANSIIIPGQVVFIHQLFNFAFVKYDPALLGETVRLSLN
jgi:hypothetical protein